MRAFDHDVKVNSTSSIRLAQHPALHCSFQCNAGMLINKFVFATTASVYGSSDMAMVDEDIVLAPIIPYCAAMAMV